MTYPEMNEKLVGLLRLSDNPASLYAADRIEELETKAALVPELLVALRLVTARYQDEAQEIDFPTMNMARAAITKVEKLKRGGE